MIQERKTQPRALTARSVVASTLLGTEPPRLPVRVLVRAGELFGIAEGTTRVALSRMAAAGELEADDGWYRLTGRLLERQSRQARSRAAATRRWTGWWRQAIVTEDRRPAAERSELRTVMAGLRLAELREGVWLRPDNLDLADLVDLGDAGELAARCTWLRSKTTDGADAALAARLWDLDGWAATAAALRAELAATLGPLEAGDTSALGPGFVLSASVLRHFQADPLLPSELLPGGWPGPALRQDYDRYDTAYRALLGGWFHALA